MSLDLSRAFDRVWHRGLLAKLKACGITGDLHNWLTDFLSDRFQTVTVSGQESTALPVRAGVRPSRFRPRPDPISRVSERHGGWRRKQSILLCRRQHPPSYDPL